MPSAFTSAYTSLDLPILTRVFTLASVPAGITTPLTIALAEVEDDISIFADGDLSGTYNAEGNINLTSTANINASANATGFESSSSGTPIAASVYVDAGGDALGLDAQ